MRVPDLGVTCSPYQTEQAALPDAVLLVEILSPSNQSKTWTNVWTYTSIPSVQEILVLRTDRVGAELLRRSREGDWPERPLKNQEAAARQLLCGPRSGGAIAVARRRRRN